MTKPTDMPKASPLGGEGMVIDAGLSPLSDVQLYAGTWVGCRSSILSALAWVAGVYGWRWPGSCRRSWRTAA